MTQPNTIVQRLPVVLLYQMMDRPYLYDANLDVFTPISFDTFQKLNVAFQSVHDGKVEIEKNSEIEKLIAKGFLSENRVEELRHPLIETMRTFSQRALASITLQVTQSCNLRCKYCIYSNQIKKQRSHSQKKMEFETAIKGIDFLYERSMDAPRINIGFYGGEPLLEFDMIKRLVEYAEEKFRGKEIGFSITTNATLLTEEKYTYMQCHNFSITISIDGNRESHNRNRVFLSGKGSFDQIARNIKAIKEIHPDVPATLTISTVIDPEIPLTLESSTASEFLKGIRVNAAVVELEDPNQIAFSEDFSEKYQYFRFLSLRKFYGKLSASCELPTFCSEGIEKLYHEFKSLGSCSRLPQIGAPDGPCMPGLLRLFINADGDFFPCEKVSELSEVMNIGSIYKGFDFGKMENIINFSTISHRNCKTCPVFRHCGICAKLCDGGDKLSEDAFLSACSNSIDDFKGRLKYWTLFYKELKLDTRYSKV